MDRRAFLTGSATLAALGPLASCRTAFEYELERVRTPAADHYWLAKGLIYFNHGSIGTIPKLVQNAHEGYLRECETNPWLYMWGGAWEAAREQSRQAAADYLGCHKDEIAINRNTTDGFNLLASGLPIGKGDEVLFSNLNHPGASVAFDHQAKVRGFTVRRFDVPVADVSRLTAGQFVEWHVAAITKATRVLVLPHIDNILGIRAPLKELAKAAKAKGVEFVCVDAAQSAGMIDVKLDELGIDAYCMSPHKWIQSPKGLGLLYIPKAIQQQVRPQIVTWGQRRWRGSARRYEDFGTRDLPAVMALRDAIAFQQNLNWRADTMRHAKVHELRRDLRDAVLARVDADDCLVFRSPRDYAMNGSLYAIEVRGKKSPQLADSLWKKTRAVTRAFGAKDLNTVRLSPNAMNTVEELDRFFAALAQL